MSLNLFKLIALLLVQPAYLRVLPELNDADVNLNFPGLALKYGYLSQEHVVVTKDGYVLTIFRMAGGRKCGEATKPLPMMMLHGLRDSSDTFIITGPEEGLGYILADACYDVWFPNTRGNRYSRHHITLDPDTDKEFWNFSYDEVGRYDLSVVIDYILSQTNAVQLIYIGHSIGTTELLVLTSTWPEYNDKLNLSILLAPVAWMFEINDPLLKAIGKNTPGIKKLLDASRLFELLGRNMNAVLKPVCSYFPNECDETAHLFFGFNPNSVSDEQLKAISGHFNSSTSSRLLEHLGQGVMVDKFRRYDYGKTKNLQAYGTGQPPDYDLNKVTTAVVLMCAEYDMIASCGEVQKLRDGLPNVVGYHNFSNDWSHGDFVWGRNTVKYIVPLLLDYLKLTDGKIGEDGEL